MEEWIEIPLIVVRYDNKERELLSNWSIAKSRNRMAVHRIMINARMLDKSGNSEHGCSFLVLLLVMLWCRDHLRFCWRAPSKHTTAAEPNALLFVLRHFRCALPLLLVLDGDALRVGALASRTPPALTLSARDHHSTRTPRALHYQTTPTSDVHSRCWTRLDILFPKYS